MAQPFSVLLRAFILETVAGGLVDLPIQDPAIGEQLDQLMNNQGPIPNWFSQWQQQNQAQLQERFNALNLSITNAEIRRRNAKAASERMPNVMVTWPHPAPQQPEMTLVQLEVILAPEIDDLLGHYGVIGAGDVEVRRKQLHTFLGI